nr:thioredoxin Y1, chloroplastic [Ipomoea batatas]
MAISAKSAALYSLNTKHRSAAAPLTSHSTSKLSRFSSLQLPRQLRCVGIGFHGSDPKSRPRTLPLVQAKETFSSFDDVLENSDKPVLVDFYATWCGPCQFMVPILNDVGNAMKDKIQVVKIDTEKYPSIADRYKIQALPTFILFKDGEPCDRFEGALSADNLIKRIEDALKLVQ